MILRLRFVTFLAVCLAWLAASANVHAQFDALANRVPNGANVLVLINAEQLHESALAKKENWRERHDRMFAAGMLLLPPQANQMVMAAHMDIEVMHQEWNASILNLNFDPSMPKLAIQYGGNVDRIADREAAVLPNNTYVVRFGPRLGGIMFPANRQTVTRWVNSIYMEPGRKPLSEYLAEGLKYATDIKTPIIMAMDLEHVVAEAHIRDKLNNLETLKDKQVDLDKLAELLASIRGVTLGVTVTDRAVGAIKVDFGQDVAPMKSFAKELLLEVLGNQGAMIEEVRDWSVSVEGKTVLLQGDLFKSGLQRIFSVIDTPPGLHLVSQSPSETSPGQTEASLIALTSKQYFSSLESLITDLTRKRQSNVQTTPGQIGMWFERYASKIDSLPVLHVDKQLVDFAGQAANQLRGAESSMKGVGARTAMRISEKPNAAVYNTRYAVGGGVNRWGGAYGGYAWRSSYEPRQSLRIEGQQRAQIRTQERVKGFASANEIMSNLQSEMGNVRRAMTQKYNVEF